MRLRPSALACVLGWLRHVPELSHPGFRCARCGRRAAGLVELMEGAPCA